jgi:formate C-acetyltransferase
MIRDLVEQTRERLLETPDTVCLERAWLVTEAYRRHAYDPVPLRRARALSHVLRHMTLDLDTNPVFAGNTASRPRAWMLLPEYRLEPDAQVVFENPGLAGLLDGAVPQEITDFWADKHYAGANASVGHLAVDMARVVHKGLEAIIAETERCAEDPDPDRRVYRQAMAIALQGVIEWAGRYARAAESAAERTADPARREAHLRVARACRQVPAKPARDLFEGLQAMALVHLATFIEGQGVSVCIGLPDRVLAPFIAEPFEKGAVTDLVSAFELTEPGALPRRYLLLPVRRALTPSGRPHPAVRHHLCHDLPPGGRSCLTVPPPGHRRSTRRLPPAALGTWWTRGSWGSDTTRSRPSRRTCAWAGAGRALEARELWRAPSAQ